jgi:hypothetical protein
MSASTSSVARARGREATGHLTGTWARHWLPLAVLGGGLLLRLVLAFVVYPGQGLATDLGLFSSWAATLARVGPGGFYAVASTANYPPGYLWVLWPIGVLGGGVELLKLPAILADVGIAATLYVVGRRWLDERAGLVAAALYLFVPVTWYDSALWGQVDAVGALVMLTAVVLLAEGWSEPATALAALSVLVKPQDAVVLVVVLPVLVRRHLLRPGSGPRPRLPKAGRAIEPAVDWVLADQGPLRLATSGLAALAVVALVLLPFDITLFAPTSLADVPLIGHLAGLVGLVLGDTGQFSVLTANAFDLWALVGPTPLASVIGAGGGSWTADSLPIVAGLSAATIGAGLLIGTALVVAVGLLLRDGRMTLVLSLAVMAFAFYALPTRVHERYLVPFFAPGALLAAAWLPAVGWYVVVAVLDALDLHTILADPSAAGTSGFGVGRFGVGRFGGGAAIGGGPARSFGGVGPGGSAPGGPAGASGITLPLPDLARSELAVAVIAMGQTAGFVLLLGAWLLAVIRPGVLARLTGRDADGRSTDEARVVPSLDPGAVGRVAT